MSYLQVPVRLLQQHKTAVEQYALINISFDTEKPFRQILRKEVLDYVTEKKGNSESIEIGQSAGRIRLVSPVHYKIIALGFGSDLSADPTVPARAEVLGLDQRGGLIWDTTSPYGSELISIGDLMRAYDAGFLEHDPSSIAVYFRGIPDWLTVGGNMMVTPPDAWNDLVSLVVLLLAVAQADDLLVKYTDLVKRLGSACLRIRAMRDARQLPTDVPPQRLVRFIRSRQAWDSPKLGKLLRLKLDDVEALLTFCGYQKDDKEGLWKPQLDPTSSAEHDLIPAYSF